MITKKKIIDAIVDNMKTHEEGGTRQRATKIVNDVIWPIIEEIALRRDHAVEMLVDGALIQYSAWEDTRRVPHE